MSGPPAGPRLHIAALGSRGPRVVFLHGLFGQGKNWTAIARALEDEYRVTLLDLPNHGRSPWTTELGYPEMADWVASTLRAVTGEDPDGPASWTVVGHSMGGKVAMALALQHPGLVGRLGVVDIAPVSYDRMSSFGEYVRAMGGLDLASVRTRADADAALAAAVPDARVRGFLLQNLRRDAGGPSGWRWQMNLDLLGDSLGRLGEWPLPDATPYPGPVLWVAGARSDYVRPAYAEPMRRLFPRTQLVTLKHVGHWVHSEQPEVFLATLRRFLNRQQGELHPRAAV